MSQQLNEEEIDFITPMLEGSVINFSNYKSILSDIRIEFKQKFKKELKLSEVGELYELYEQLPLNQCEKCEMILQQSEMYFNSEGERCCGECVEEE